MPESECKFYTQSIPTWDSMLEDCNSATKSIYIEQYIFDEDMIGTQFIETIRDKSKSGVKVKLLLDMIGSINFYNSKTPDLLRKEGIEVKFFNVVKPWKILKYFHWLLRDHRKLLIIDEVIAYTGGLGIRDNMSFWRDTTARVRGQVVFEMIDSFNDMFKRADDHGAVKRIRNYRTQIKREYFVTNDPYFKKRFLYYTFVESLRNAKNHIYITNPYFIPDRRMSRVLRSAAKRGIDVRILIPTKMDIPVIESASNATLEKLLECGIRFYRYSPVFLHAKTAVVDDNWATFGSFNLDSLSFRYNHEANIVTFDKKCVADLKEIFYLDLKDSVEISYESWKKRGRVNKTREFFASLIASFL